MHSCVNTIVFEGVVDNTQADCKKMIRKLQALQPGLKVCDFIFCDEHIGFYSIEVADYLSSKKYVIWLESQNDIK